MAFCLALYIICRIKDLWNEKPTVTLFIQLITLYKTTTDIKMFHRHHLITLSVYYQKGSRLTVVRRWSISVVSLYGPRVFHTKGWHAFLQKIFRDCVWCQMKVLGVFTALRDKDLKKYCWLFWQHPQARHILFSVCALICFAHHKAVMWNALPLLWKFSI